MSTQLHGHQRAQIVGTTGRIEVDIPVNSPKDRPTKLTVVEDNRETEVLSFGPVDQFSCQADAFGAAIRSTQPAATPLNDAIANMTVVDAVFASAASGGWCAV